MTAQIHRLMHPKLSAHRTDIEYSINRAMFYWMMIGSTTLNIVLSAYLESMKLSGMAEE